MNFGEYLATGQTTVTVGEYWDPKACFNSSDYLFECLDSHNLININPKVCTRELQSWAASCNPSVRRDQMITRRQVKQNHQLYTQEQLNVYNRRKNQEVVWG